MSICSVNCSILPPRPIKEGCGLTVRSGGISRLVFASCNIQFIDVTDLSEWCTLVNEGKIIVTSPIIGQKPKGSSTKKRLSSCQSESVIGFERTITFQDYNSDNLYADFDFYNDILENSALYKFGWITCDGLFFGLIDEFTIEVDQIIEDTNLGSTYWDGIISWTGFNMSSPIKLNGLISVLQGNCNNIPNYTPCKNFGILPDVEAFICENGLLLSGTYLINTTYKWYFKPLGGIDFIQIINANEHEYFATEPGTYYLEYKINGCSIVVTNEVIVDDLRPEFALPAFNITNSDGTYADIIIHALNPSNIEYSIIVNNTFPTAFQSSNIFTHIIEGTHTLQIKNTVSGCVNTKQITFNLNTGGSGLIQIISTVYSNCDEAVVDVGPITPGANYNFYAKGNTPYSFYPNNVWTLVQSGPSLTCVFFKPCDVYVALEIAGNEIEFTSIENINNNSSPPNINITISPGSNIGLNILTFDWDPVFVNYVTSTLGSFITYTATKLDDNTIYTQNDNPLFIDLPNGYYALDITYFRPENNFGGCGNSTNISLFNGTAYEFEITSQPPLAGCNLTYPFVITNVANFRYDFYVKESDYFTVPSNPSIPDNWTLVQSLVGVSTYPILPGSMFYVEVYDPSNNLVFNTPIYETIACYLPGDPIIPIEALNSTTILLHGDPNYLDYFLNLPIPPVISYNLSQDNGGTFITAWQDSNLFTALSSGTYQGYTLVTLLDPDITCITFIGEITI